MRWTFTACLFISFVLCAHAQLTTTVTLPFVDGNTVVEVISTDLDGTLETSTILTIDGNATPTTSSPTNTATLVIPTPTDTNTLSTSTPLTTGPSTPLTVTTPTSFRSDATYTGPTSGSILNISDFSKGLGATGSATPGASSNGATSSIQRESARMWAIAGVTLLGIFGGAARLFI